MSLYQLPKLEFPKLNAPTFRKNKIVWLIFLIIIISVLFGLALGFVLGGAKLNSLVNNLTKHKVIEKERIVEKQPVYIPQTSQEEATIKVVKDASPAVVSIVITKDVPKLELFYENPFRDFGQFFGQPFDFQIPQLRQQGTEKKEVGGGTGFIVSEQGIVLTNAHVVADKEADYTVLTNDGKKYPAKVLARDEVRDLAIMKIEEKSIAKSFPTLKLGDSNNLQIGQTVITIGNALGEFRNTVSVGVISGLGRRVTASGGDSAETLEDVIQTDAAINPGNSGGPLLNLKGEVIGVNFAMAQQAENIAFTIPINRAKKDIEQVEKFGKISHPFLGVQYLLLNEEIQQEKNLPASQGAWITRWTKNEAGNWQLTDSPAVVTGSPAEKAGLRENDIISELNNEKITLDNTLAKIIAKHNVGDKANFKVLRNGKEVSVDVVLGERSE